MKKLITIVIFSLGLILNIQGFAQQGNLNSNGTGEKVGPDSFSKAIYFDRVGPLKDFPALTPEELATLNEKERTKVRNKDLQHRSYPNAANALPKGPDEVWQKINGRTRNLTNIIQNFNGQNSNSFPPDCNGSAGPNHFFQTVNVTYSIYDKTGTQVIAPTNLNTLFSGVPGSNFNDGDPILLYDDNADRWLAAEFSISGSNYMLIAISVTSDPTGDWYRWSWAMNGMPDYMKFGVWEDGYYMGTNTSSGSDIYVFEREEMLIGATSPQMVKFDNPNRPLSGFHCVLPVDCDGDYAPAGTPGMFLTINDDAWGGGGDALWLFQLDVDWNTPASSTFQRTQVISVSPFDSNFGSSWDNIAQKGTGQKLDAINQVLMYRVQYRNFGTEKRIVCNHTVDVDGTDHAGIRWYELELNGDTWEIRQEGTYAPDEHSRWMGSIAMNSTKDIALGYSVSSSSKYPGIYYCGQSSLENNVASGIMDIAEGVILEGTASQTGINRWGDYSNMSVDPVDDKTFWFTTEYMLSSSNHGSKIASLYFAELLGASFTASSTSVFAGSTINFTDQSTGDPTSWQWTFEGGDPATSSEQNPSVFYSTPGVYDVTLTVGDGTNTNTMIKQEYITIKEEILSIDPISATVGMDAGSTVVALDANKYWNTSENCEWVTVSPSAGLSGLDITISYEANTGVQRQCVITFATSTLSVDFTLNQDGTAEILSIDPMSETVNNSASSTEVAITSNTSWTVGETCDWLTVTPESGEGDAVLTVTYDENATFDSRECIIHVAAATISSDYTLTQNGVQASITTDIASETVTSDPSSIQVEVTSNVEWAVDETCDWISVTPETGNNVTTTVISYLENESFTESRTCEVHFVGGGTSAIVEIIQLPKVAELGLSTNEENVGWQAGNFQTEVTTNTEWSVSNPCEWITVNPVSGS
ncbi:MAG: BACON domain-containing carbohydrate-binding protein, partial [Bacteroidales bacterium]